MKAYVDSMIRLSVADADQSVLGKIERALTLPNPDYLAAMKMDRWTGNLDPNICGYSYTASEMLIPRGFGSRLRTIAPGLAVDWGGLGDGEPLEARAAVEPYPYQGPAVDALCGGQGVVVMPCGAGKTVAALLALAKVGRTALVMVHTNDLAEQWIREAEAVIGVSASRIGGGKKKIGGLTVATMQSLQRWSDAELGCLGALFGVVIVDEAHHAPCKTYTRILSHMPARYRWGLTATPEREDGLTDMMGWALGDILCEVDRSELFACGKAVPARVEKVNTGWTYPDLNTDKMHECHAALIADEGRNGLILDMAWREVKDGHAVLILTGRKDHVATLTDALGYRGVTAAGLTSQAGKKKRAAALGGFRDGTVPVIVATQLADEGLDVPNLDRIFNVFPTRAQARTIQRLGRLMRPRPGKEPVLYDFVDDVGVLQNQWWARSRAYRKALT